ncbi:hypothetical protein SAMN05216353_11644 [Halobacillus alkaliphilus]|uniref:Uncharacterized protein n=2 Tax=Halobacillus alkaliphilus TaxID=396056 RepID=A0A1I2MYT2_9BACI|nr:hypothetical protein SAMN05216353_11644 [Halobacillus alkaliphilus]
MGSTMRQIAGSISDPRNRHDETSGQIEGVNTAFWAATIMALAGSILSFCITNSKPE